MPPLFSRKCDTCSLYYDQKADILSTYFHDDRLNASEVGQSSICERIGRERPFN